MPAWTTLTPLVTGDLVTEDDFDAIHGNLNYLLNPNRAAVELTDHATYTTTSTSFVDVDATNLTLTLETYGGPVLITVLGVLSSSSTNAVFFDVAIDGERISGASAGISRQYADVARPANFTLPVVLAAGTHTLTLQWRVSSGTGYLMAGSGAVLHFSAMEL